MSAGAAILEARDVVVLLGGAEAMAAAGRCRRCAPSAASRWRCRRARRWAWSASPAAARPRSARTLLGIQRETGGEIRLDGRVVSGMPPRAGAAWPGAPCSTCTRTPAPRSIPGGASASILEEGLIVHGLGDAGAREKKIDAILAAVGLDGSFKPRYVHELSGGQLRRVALARILLLEPRIVILDEPTSGLDLSVQATVLSLIADLKARLGLTYLLISHDLSVVRAHVRPRRHHVSRPHRRGRAGARHLRLPAPSLHAGAARRRAAAWSPAASSAAA